MAKFQSPLLGYNNNVRHRGRIFHIQTEDSGVNHPHIITHLFMDGGRILKSVKKSYAEHVGSDGLSETVRGLMKDQHKEMFIALRDGQFDDLVGGGVKKPSGQVVAPAKKEEPKLEAKAPPPPVAEGPATDKESQPTAAKAEAPAPVTPPKRIPPPKIDLSKIERPKTESKIDAAAVEAAAAKAAAATAKVLADEEPAFLTELAASPEVAITEAAATSLIGSGPATHPDPPRVSEDMAPNTIAEEHRDRDGSGVEVIASEEEIDLDMFGEDIPLPSDSSDEVMVVDVDEPPKTSPEELALGVAATDPPPPLPPSVRIPSPQSTTDPSAVLERAATVAAMPASRPGKRPAVSVVGSDENPNTTRDPEKQERRHKSAEELTLDFDALERDSHSDQVSPHFQSTDLPPPPKNLFAKERGTGTYSAMIDEPSSLGNHEKTPSVIPPSRPQPNTARSSVAAPPSADRAERSKPSQKPTSEGRYAPARPAAIFGSSPSTASGTAVKPPPPQQAAPTSSSLFNDDLVSDKSLDEVILSYLAEDLDPPRRK